MPLRPLLLAAALVFSCSGESPKDGTPAADPADASKPVAQAGDAPGEAPADADSSGPNAGDFDFANAEACDLLSTADVAEAYGLDASAVTADANIRARPHRKSCRYTWKDADVAVALLVEAEAKREGPAAARLMDPIEAARGPGMPVLGRDGVVQTFESITGLGDEAFYSGNVTDSKGLLARFGDRYVVTLQHNHFGQDTGDQKPALLGLAGKIAGKLGV